MKKIFIFLFSVAILCGSAAFGKEFRVGRESGYEEISVNAGEQFRISLEGKGWYLNRYDKERLRFRYRIIGQSDTSFLILPKKAGSGYLLFSYITNDVYVKVSIDGLPLSQEAPPGMEAEREVKEEGSGDVETAEMEAGEKGKETPQIETDAPVAKPPGEQARESEIYYTDREDRVVAVPIEDEDENYRRGVKLRKKNMHEKAVKNFSDYLDSCEECRYRIDASMKLAQSLITVGRVKKAIQYLDMVIESGSPNYFNDALVMRGNLHYEEGNLKEALESYSRYMEAGNENPGIMRRVADIHYNLNDYRNALDLYERLKKLNELDDEILFRAATIYDSPGEPRDVEKAYRYYRLLVGAYKDSRYRPFAEKRIDFLEKNFFNYR